MRALASLSTLAVLAGLTTALHAGQAQSTPWKRRLPAAVALHDSSEDPAGLASGSLTLEGDRVGDTDPEDRILTARRRLLKKTNPGSKDLGEIAFVSPLDGYPRFATSGLGEPRDNGKRLHRGIDLASEHGEPVRSVAAGEVIFAGVDWERRAHIALEPWGAAIVHQRHMGPRGLFVVIDHGSGVTSLYAHLASYDVKVGDRVHSGERIGEVGRTGIRHSDAHLHFGLFQNGEVLDPLDHLAGYVFPAASTVVGPAALRETMPGCDDLHKGGGAPPMGGTASGPGARLCARKGPASPTAEPDRCVCQATARRFPGRRRGP